MRLHLLPQVRGDDPGEGGVRRVAEAMQDGLPAHGIELVDRPQDADIIAAHIEFPKPYVKLFPRKPFVLHCHGLYWSEYVWEQWAYKANELVMESVRVADVVTAPSDWVQRILQLHTCRDVRTVPHGVNIAEWEPGENRGYVWWDKNRPDPVCDPEPVEQLADLMPEQQFIATFGRERANLVTTGRIPYVEARDYTRQASVYLATTRETFGVSTLQAMAAGVPIVGWAWGATPELVNHEVEGWLCQPGDVEGLRQGIRWAQENRAAIAERGMETASHYTWERACEEYAAIYHEQFERARLEREGPRVSIIVPAYGLEDYLPATLDSVLAQDDPNWECVVVDDASPDRCGEIADSYAQRDPRFRVIHNAENQYLAGARNTGIKASRGRYILPLDADDMLTPNAIGVLATALDDDRTLDVAYGNVYFVKDDGKTPENYGRTPGHSGWPYQFRLDWQLQQRNLLPYSSMYRKRAWRLTGGYRTRCRTAEDADFWTRVSSYGYRPRMVTTADTLIYRNREGSMSRREGTAEWARWFGWVGGDVDRWPSGARGTSEATLPANPGVPSLDPAAIAVIIPVGPGHAQYVQTAVDSIEAQDFRRYEVIVVNDDPDTRLDDFLLPCWVRLIDSTHGKGPGHHKGWGTANARNVGIAAAKARLFLPLDADDYLQPGALRAFYDAYTSGEPAVIYSDFWEDPQGHWQVYETEDYDPDKLTKRGLLHAVTALTPKRWWEEVGGYPKDTAWEDWAFALKLADKGHCSRRVAAPLFSYRKHTGARRNQNVGDFEESQAQMRELFSDRFWGKGQKLMACSKCPKGRVTTMGPPTLAPRNPANIGNPRQPVPAMFKDREVVLVRYTGAKAGNFTRRGRASGVSYQFSSHQPVRYVLKEDADALLQQADMEVAKVAFEGPQPPPVGEPALTAPGSLTVQTIDPAPPEPAPAQSEPTEQSGKACEGSTKAGEPCKNKALPNSPFCRIHDPVPATA